ncbi:MAG: phosphonoacetaldehyde hydrolase [Planctomycetota bacterium]
MSNHQLKGIVFDWAGTMIDHGSLAPAVVFQRVFKKEGVEISVDEARGPMGMAKREHIEAVSQTPRVADAWLTAKGATCSSSDIDRMYAEFIPQQRAVLEDHCELIPGAAEAAELCRDRGMRIGSSTGYTRELMEVVTPLAAKQGYSPDVVLCAEDAPRGRPAPFLIFEFAKRLDVFPLWHTVKVDDTTVGIEAGRNAGCWTVGIEKTGNLLGLTQQEVEALPEQDCQDRCNEAAAKLKLAGAHYTIGSVAEIAGVLNDIEHRIAAGELPI